MPCWFYDRKELVNTPSARDGISAEVEAWYRKEGAKHIIDAGNKLGLYLFIKLCVILVWLRLQCGNTYPIVMARSCRTGTVQARDVTG